MFPLQNGGGGLSAVAELRTSVERIKLLFLLLARYANYLYTYISEFIVMLVLCIIY